MDDRQARSATGLGLPLRWPAICLTLLMTQPGCHHTVGPQTRAGTEIHGPERQVTTGARGRVLTNTGVWSPDGEWIAYDTRSDAAGEKFDGNTIEAVHVRTGEVKELYRSRSGAHCGVVSWHPREPKVVFILGPEDPTPDWSYGAAHRQGIIVSALPTPSGPASCNLDARDLTPPFTPGALRGGSHVHVWEAPGDWISFTYEDAVLSKFREATGQNDINQRNIGVGAPLGRVQVTKDHSRNHDGQYFSVLVTRTVANPHAGSDEILKACEEGWVGTNGYVRRDGTRQRRALAFQGHVVAAGGQTVVEVFLVDLPEDLTAAGAGPLEGTATRMPFPPRGCVQRRLTFTADRPYPGVQGPRHWLRCAPDGRQIGFLMRDEGGTVQLWTVSPAGGSPRQLTRNRLPVSSAFTWSPDGRFLGHVMDNSVCVTDAISGETRRLTPRTADAPAPRPEACVFSPDGRRLAYVRRTGKGAQASNQIFVCAVE